MKFSVIIPTYKDWERTMSCLSALKQQTIDEDQYEIIVVDNSESGIVPADIDFPSKVQLVHEPTPGSYAARNKGAEVAAGEILAFTDSDCIPDKNWLLKAKDIFSNSECDMIGGRVDIFQPENGDKYGYLYERLTAFHQHKHVPEGKSVTANLLIKKKVFEESGGFDPDIKSGGDWEFTLRCTKMGYQMIYGDEVLVLHPARDLLTIFKKHHRLSCGGAQSVQTQYGHSYLRILASHLRHGLNSERAYKTEPGPRERVIIFCIDIMKYLYRTVIYGGLVLRLIDPKKVRE